MITGVAVLLLNVTALRADDNENTTTSDKSTNPITGTQKETTHHKVKAKNADGSTTTHDHKKVKKTKTDGSTTTTDETENQTK